MDDIIQLKITLKWTKPPIWRRVQVDRKTTFFELHHIIQIAMGWENYHLFQFNFDGDRIGEPSEEDIDFFNFGFGSGRKKRIDASTVTLDSFITEVKEKFEYEYDFGDGWIHQILVEKFLPRDSTKVYPVCTGGKRNCPPEDCGGVGGFYYMLEAIKDKKHPDYNHLTEWLGGDFDTEYFDKDDINVGLKYLQAYIKALDSDG